MVECAIDAYFNRCVVAFEVPSEHSLVLPDRFVVVCEVAKWFLNLWHILRYVSLAQIPVIFSHCARRMLCEPLLNFCNFIWYARRVGYFVNNFTFILLFLFIFIFLLVFFGPSQICYPSGANIWNAQELASICLTFFYIDVFLGLDIIRLCMSLNRPLQIF